MPTLLSIYLNCASGILGYMLVWFAASLWLERNDIADIAWGLGFVVATAIAWRQNPQPGLVANLAMVYVAIWGSRLAWHISGRNRGKSEDYRYAAWRREWGKWFYVRSFVQVFLLQGALLLVVAAPAIVAAGMSSANALSPISLLGVAVWIMGFAFESIGDWQLGRYLRLPSPKPKVLATGLWRYSRHPNYFGEISQWWGLWLIAAGTTYWLPAIIGPIMITLLITKVSGIPLLESHLMERPEFVEYARRTSLLIPWPPRAK